MAGFLSPCRSIVIRRQGTLETLLPEEHLARFVWKILCDMDFTALEAGYHAEPDRPGRPPYHPRLLTALWVYGMTQGLETASAIAEACQLRDDFRWVAGGLCPSDQTLLNFLAKGEQLSSIWVQVLQAMQREGHIDLSVIAEDGTKLLANASRRSFHTAEEIEEIRRQLETQLRSKLDRQSRGETPHPTEKAQVRALRERLARAERAAQELIERATPSAERRQETPPLREAPSRSSGEEQDSDGASAGRFGPADFNRQAEPDALICPAGETLRLIGRYPTDSGHKTYRLYGRRDCTGCQLKERCTTVRGRRVKILEVCEERASTTTSGGASDAAHDGDSGARRGERNERKSQASLTDPEAKLMLATSEKRWEPAYNADLAVTQQQVIVSQFVSKRPTDFHHFAPALRNVLSTLGQPQKWVGDGHYGTYDNLRLAHQEAVLLFAPPAVDAGRRSERRDSESDSDSSPETASAPPSHMDAVAPRRFGAADFQHDATKNVVTCPAGQELRFIGQYPRERGWGSYRLYGRSDCTDCALKDRCTTGRGRRFKLYAAGTDAEESAELDGDAYDTLGLVRALRTRMDEQGEQMRKLRGQTVEPVHAQVKQHGLGHLHVRGLTRCAAILTLACLSHNLMKWYAMTKAHSMKIAS